jgi:flagellar motor switch/type III secretory pathway protein FliN
MSTAVTVQPFPWSSLEAIVRADVGALQEMRRWIARSVRLEPFARALTELVGDDVQLVGARASRGTSTGVRAFEGGLCVVLAPGDDAATALLEVEPALAAALLARVLQRPPLGAVKVTAHPSPEMAGALAAVVVAALRRAHADAAPPRVLSAGGAASVLDAFASPASAALAVSLTVLVGDDAYAARLVLRRGGAFAAPPAEWTARQLAALGEVPLSLPIVACATPARVSDVGALRVGDAWLPGTWPLDLAREHAAGAWSLRGPVLLAAPAAVSGVRARLAPDGRLVLSGEVDAVCGAEATMTESEGERTLLDAVGDVPVIVRVEIGEARMAARDLASLVRGDVITVGRRVGELVLLRVGGIPVARGELVNVDGEVGVRIAERLAGDTTRA